MCPQKWYASASPGLISEPAVCAPASAITPAPTRERKPRRDVLAASVSESRSGTERTPPPLRGGQDGLQLRARVERALGQHGAVVADRHRERAARHVGQRPRVGVFLLVEAAQRHPGVALEVGHGGLERAAEVGRPPRPRATPPWKATAAEAAAAPRTGPPAARPARRTGGSPVPGRRSTRRGR